MVIIQPIRKKRPRIAPIPLGFAKLTEEITGTDRPFDIFTGRFYMETEGVLFTGTLRAIRRRAVRRW